MLIPFTILLQPTTVISFAFNMLYGHMEIEHAENVIRNGSIPRPLNTKMRREALRLDTTEVSTLSLYPEEARMG